MRTVIDLEKVNKTYQLDDVEVDVLHGINIKIHEKEFVSIMGASGSGKSTLLNIIGVLDRPTSGKVCLDGVDISKLDDSELARLRGQRIGFVFQFFNRNNITYGNRCALSCKQSGYSFSVASGGACDYCNFSI